MDWQSRAQFFGLAAQFMRRVLVDHARARQSAKRLGAAAPVPLDEAAVFAERGPALVALDDAWSAWLRSTRARQPSWSCATSAD